MLTIKKNFKNPSLNSYRNFLFLQHFNPRQWLFSSLPLNFLPRFYFIFVFLSFSFNFISPNHLISTQIHCHNFFPNFSSPSIVPSSTPFGIALRADRSWLFEVSRFSYFVFSQFHLYRPFDFSPNTLA